MKMVEVTLMGLVEEVGLRSGRVWLAGKGREREREDWGMRLRMGLFEVGGSRLVLGRVVVVFRYRIASIFSVL